MKLILLLLLALSSVAFAKQAEISRFSSDGCSSWPEGPILDKNRWRSCCFTHDISYWMGGTEQDRINADAKLYNCVGEKQDKFMGWIMYTGVRVGGSPGYNTPYRWGYGWNYSRPYRALNKTEQRMITKDLNDSCFVREDEELIIKYMKARKIPMSILKTLGR